MSSYPLPRISPHTLVLWLAALWLAFSAPVQAVSSVSVGSGSMATASLDFRIVIPGHLHLSLSESVGGRATLDAELYSRRGALAVSGAGESSVSDSQDGNRGEFIRTTRMQAVNGVYTIASP